MGRAALDWTVSRLATAAGVSVSTINRFERGHFEPRGANMRAIRAALEDAGIQFIPANGGGPGVRLKEDKT